MGTVEAPRDEPATLNGSPKVSAERRLYLTTLALLAVSFMLFQIAVLRELRFQLSSTITIVPFLFSGVIALIGLGSLAAERIGANSRRVLGWSALILPVMLLPLFSLVIVMPQLMVDRSDAFRYSFQALPPGASDSYLSSVIQAFLVVAVVGYGPVFFLQGMIFALYFREGRQTGVLSNVYAVDLLASGAGALIGGALTFVLTPVQTVLAASGVLLLTLGLSSRHVGIRPSLVAGVSIVTLALGATELATGLVASRETPVWLGKEVTYSQWTRYRRIDAVDLPDSLWILSDGIPFQNHDKNDVEHAAHPRAMPAVLARTDEHIRDVLVVGSGTGSDVRLFRHLVPRNLRIVGVELDGGFVTTAQAYPWLWNTYRTADIVVQEGRYFLENDRRDFDLVYYAYIDPGSAISSVGLPDANFMYTDAGLQRAWEKVRPGGYFLLTRVYLTDEQDEFIRRLCATLKTAGFPADAVRLYRSKDTIWGELHGGLARVYVLARKGAVTPEYRDPRLISLAWVDGGRPTTDLFPLSFITGMWFDILLQFLWRHTIALVLLGIASLALLLRLATSPGHLNFFILGFGSFVLESLVLFNSFLLIGDPNLSAALAVGVFLVWNGVGSLLSPRLEASRWFYWAVPLVVLLYSATAPLLNAHTITLAMPLRILAFSLHLALAGIVAGAMFPIALRSFREARVNTMFFIDLVGCAVAPIAFWIALSLYGFWLVAAGAVLSYAIVGATLAFRRGKRSATTA